MIAYLDLDFVLRLVVKSSVSSQIARIIAPIPAPYRLTWWHVCQVEDILKRQAAQGDASVRAAAKEALLEWRHHLDEMIFDPQPAQWDAAMIQAARLASQWTEGDLPVPGLLLHPACAAASGFTHFVSLHPPLRRAAKLCHLQVLPEKWKG